MVARETKEPQRNIQRWVVYPREAGHSSWRDPHVRRHMKNVELQLRQISRTQTQGPRLHYDEDLERHPKLNK